MQQDEFIGTRGTSTDRGVNRLTPLHEPNQLLSEEDNGLDLLGYWRTVKRHKWGILSITFICLTIGLLNAFSAIPIYKAETKLLANPIQPNINPLDQYANTALIFLFYETQYEIIRSRTVAELAVDKLDLVNKQLQKQDRELAAEEQAEQKPLDQLATSIRTIKSWFQWRRWIPEAWREPTPDEPDAQAIKQQLIGSIQGGIDVKGGKQSEIINISYQADDPKYAAQVANAVADAYIEFGLSSRLTGAQKTASWLNDQLNDLRAKVKESEVELQRYQQQSGMVDTNNQQKLASERLSNLTAELIKAQTKRSEAQIRFNQVRNLKGNFLGAQSTSEVMSNPTVRTLVQEENSLTRKVTELAERYGEKHPKLIAAKSDLREARRTLEYEVDKVVDSLQKDYEVATAQEQKIRYLINSQKKDISDLGSTSFELAQLEREVDNNRRMYESFLEKFKAADVAEEYDASNVRVVDKATEPAIPFKPNKPRMIMIAGILGLFLGILFAFLREKLDNTFKTTEDIDEQLGIASLGLIPIVDQRKQEKSPELQVLHNPRSSFAENINNIRTGLLFSNIDHPPQTIMITSATGSEGKSTLSSNLAAAFAQLGKTLLLEVDLRKSVMADNFSVERVPGLTDLVAGRAPLADCLRNIEANEQLWILPRGSAPPNPLEFLSSEAFKNTLAKLRKEFKYIILDSPPMLAVSDAAVVGQLVDCTVVAVKAEATTHKMSAETLARLNKSGIEPTGAVLCQTDARRMADYGGHYYYHYDANYYGYTAKDSHAA